MLVNVTPEALPTRYWVQYGTTTEYGQRTSVGEDKDVAGSQTEVVDAGSLKVCTTYHYRAVAENEASGGVPSVGSDQTFKTECTIRITVKALRASDLEAENPRGFECVFRPVEVGAICELGPYAQEQGFHERDLLEIVKIEGKFERPPYDVLGTFSPLENLVGEPERMSSIRPSENFELPEAFALVMRSGNVRFENGEVQPIPPISAGEERSFTYSELSGEPWE
jgi:hypothetical protein